MKDQTTASGNGNTATRLLQAACELAGGEERLARRLDLSPLLLRRYVAGRSELPKQILLRVVDLLLQERESQFPAAEAAGANRGDSDDQDAAP